MSEVHFEIFRQHHGNGSWSLVEVLEKPRRSVGARPPPAAGGTCDRSSGRQGEFRSRNDLPPCDTADDLYTYGARAVIARTLGEWLAQNKLAVTELLHGAWALEKLDSGGMTPPHALQKIAVARAFC